jgi:SOS-response transcriptional repressor LexA
MKLTAFDLHDNSDIWLRSVIGHVSAGHPIELVGEEELIDLNYMVKKGSADVRLILVEGDSMCAEIHDGDFVVVACDRQPKPNDIVIAELDEGLTIKRFKLNLGHRNGLYLVPANENYKPREIMPADKMKILGVVTHVIHKTV